MGKKTDLYNETSNTAAGINTPADRQDKSPTDMLSEAVQEGMDRLRETFGVSDGDLEKADRRDER
jgi:hypothetical protein